MRIALEYLRGMSTEEALRLLPKAALLPDDAEVEGVAREATWWTVLCCLAMQTQVPIALFVLTHTAAVPQATLHVVLIASLAWAALSAVALAQLTRNAARSRDDERSCRRHLAHLATGTAAWNLVVAVAAYAV